MEVIHEVPILKREFFCIKRVEDKLIVFSYYILSPDGAFREDYFDGSGWTSRANKRSITHLSDKNYFDNTLLNDYKEKEIHERIKESYRINVKNKKELDLR